MPYLVDQPRLERLPPYILYPALFMVRECKQLIGDAQAAGLVPATVGNSAQAQQAPSVRRSHVAWLDHGPKTHWLYKRLESALSDARKNHYPVNVSGFYERIQLTRYRAEDSGHYAAHKDLAPGRASVRKLSMVALLSPPSDFEGGRLEMLGAPSHCQKTELRQGTLVVFPSYELHRVTPITKGTRWSLVTWLHGPHWR